mmetsp:Transcript_61717/g.193445  ORF Transcript_61717/g.193445 Transcript_61717/m.193445 type:complete len:229 (-) Transcript_61717:627-1313(-)
MRPPLPPGRHAGGLQLRILLGVGGQTGRSTRIREGLGGRQRQSCRVAHRCPDPRHVALLQVPGRCVSSREVCQPAALHRRRLGDREHGHHYGHGSTGHGVGGAAGPPSWEAQRHRPLRGLRAGRLGGGGGPRLGPGIQGVVLHRQGRGCRTVVHAGRRHAERGPVRQVCDGPAAGALGAHGADTGHGPSTRRDSRLALLGARGPLVQGHLGRRRPRAGPRGAAPVRGR